LFRVGQCPRALLDHVALISADLAISVSSLLFLFFVFGPSHLLPMAIIFPTSIIVLSCEKSEASVRQKSDHPVGWPDFRAIFT